MWRVLRTTYIGLIAASGVFVACGAAFHTSEEVSPEASGGQGGEAGQGTAAGGLAGQGEPAGAPSLGGASAGGEAGAGADGKTGCELLGGLAREQHCYVDVTTESMSHAEALAACESLVQQSGRAAHLLVLDTEEEQGFILTHFLQSFTDVSDAWLGLSCAVERHPDVNDCYCAKCPEEELARKQGAWSWLDGTSAHFGWVNANPNAPGRCAALAYNSELMFWGWVERQCDAKTVTPIPEHPHTYRALCEIEP
jgi:hypothetical protein